VFYHIPFMLLQNTYLAVARKINFSITHMHVRYAHFSTVVIFVCVWKLQF